ncbi:hypothetical protein shim_21070 [Shimia sp. SK013]|uniref:hypothetical protein n=1 Tax=Shimia sp. SK013 TaxID=1389006 RepID=UPI0006B67871|nr:hypothetical protein [Shimia sp. SK013]KPA21403.1 hypothetical protein shim_21070 [Shimia sp. SK013]
MTATQKPQGGVQTADAPRYVAISGLSTFSADILFYARTRQSDYAFWLATQENLSLEILRVTEEVGCSLAYPTQSIQIDDLSESS